MPRAYVNPAFAFALAFCEGALHGAAGTAIFRLVAGERDDDPGVLGNLPRSRPGRRSDKRGASSAQAKKSAPPRKRAATNRTTAAAKKQAPRARPQAGAQQRPRPQPAARSSSDPVTQAVELAGKFAAIGVRTAAGIVKRLPRP